MNAKVSIIIPSYNAERFLADTLESVQVQTYINYEVIVVDDGSTDSTHSVVKRFPEVHYYYQANRGPAAARNAGLSLATGQYVSFLDADDLWHPEMLQRCMTILEEQSSIGAVHVNWLPIDADGNLMKESSGWQPWRDDIFERLLVHIPFNTSSVVWRREYWKLIGGFDETPEVNDDWLNWLRIARRGCHFEAIEQPLVYRRMHEGGITQRQPKRIIQWRLNALDRICAELDLSQALCDRAYAEVHWIATTLSLRDGQTNEATRHFQHSVQRNYRLLGLRSTYYAIAYRGKPSDMENLDLAAADKRIYGFLNQLFSAFGVLPGSLEREARSKASFCLAQMAYGKGPSGTGEARRYLARAIRIQPKLILQRDNVAWLVRILLGPRVVRTAFSLLQKQKLPPKIEATEG